jgi:hypothetical protein
VNSVESKTNAYFQDTMVECTFPFQKEGIGAQKRGMGPKQEQNPADIKSL